MDPFAHFKELCALDFPGLVSLSRQHSLWPLRSRSPPHPVLPTPLRLGFGTPSAQFWSLGAFKCLVLAFVVPGTVVIKFL